LGKCDFYRYDWGNHCIIKDKIRGEDSNCISSEIYRDFCSYTEGFKRCPFYEEYKKENRHY